jgi:hypothetical protein
MSGESLSAGCPVNSMGLRRTWFWTPLETRCFKRAVAVHQASTSFSPRQSLCSSRTGTGTPLRRLLRRQQLEIEHLTAQQSRRPLSSATSSLLSSTTLLLREEPGRSLMSAAHLPSSPIASPPSFSCRVVPFQKTVILKCMEKCAGS